MEREGRLKTVHIKAQKEPANGIITMIQVQIKTKNKRTQADTAGYAAKTRTATWSGSIILRGSRPLSLRSPRLRFSPHSLARIGNMEGYFVFGAATLVK